MPELRQFLSVYVRDTSRRSLLLFAVLLLPIVVFYSILIYTLTDAPYADDYQALLDFMNRAVAADGMNGKILFFLEAQHNEYKLLFEQGVFLLQDACVGRVHIPFLCLLGDSFVLFLLFPLWGGFLPSSANTERRLVLFLPVPFLLFQLQYFQTLNWAMGALQNLPALFFSLTAILFLLHPKWHSFWKAVLCALLGSFSSGNGLLMLPLGLVILFMHQETRSKARLVRIGVWVLLSASCAAIYLFHYDRGLWLHPVHGSGIQTARRLNPLYMLSTLGSAISIPFRPAAFILGLLLSGWLGWMVFRQGGRRNPILVWSVAYIFLTVLGVSGLRSDFGLLQGTSSRYTIYSILLVIYSWQFLAERWCFHANGSPLLHQHQKRVLAAVVIVAVVFCFTMDIWGARRLADRKRSLLTGLALYCLHPGPEGKEGPLPQPPHTTPDYLSYNAFSRAVLIESARLGIYRPLASR